MNTILEITIISAPLLLTSFGALISELAGCMAIFLESIINLGAFFCFLYSVSFNSITIGILFSILSCSLLIGLYAMATEKLKANPFISALALNLLCNALVSVLSTRFFGTRGVLISDSQFNLTPASIRIQTTIGAFALTAIGVLWLHLTKSGLLMRITGSDAAFLESRGINPKKYRIISWVLAAFFASAAGCIFSLRLSSFVPNIASGTGWTALAAVFLGRKKTAAIIAAVFVFGAAQFGAANIQNIPGLHAMPSAVLLSLPYIAALILIFIIPNHTKHL